MRARIGGGNCLARMVFVGRADRYELRPDLGQHLIVVAKDRCLIRQCLAHQGRLEFRHRTVDAGDLDIARLRPRTSMSLTSQTETGNSRLEGHRSSPFGRFPLY